MESNPKVAVVDVERLVEFKILPARGFAIAEGDGLSANQGGRSCIAAGIDSQRVSARNTDIVELCTIDFVLVVRTVGLKLDTPVEVGRTTNAACIRIVKTEGGGVHHDVARIDSDIVDTGLIREGSVTEGDRINHCEVQCKDAVAALSNRHVIVYILDALAEGLAILPGVRTVADHILVVEGRLMDDIGEAGDGIAVLGLIVGSHVRNIESTGLAIGLAVRALIAGADIDGLFVDEGAEDSQVKHIVVQAAIIVSSNNGIGIFAGLAVLSAVGIPYIVVSVTYRLDFGLGGNRVDSISDGHNTVATEGGLPVGNNATVVGNLIKVAGDGKHDGLGIRVVGVGNGIFILAAGLVEDKLVLADGLVSDNVIYRVDSQVDFLGKRTSISIELGVIPSQDVHLLGAQC